jgi:hypothetical protein
LAAGFRPGFSAVVVDGREAFGWRSGFCESAALAVPAPAFGRAGLGARTLAGLTSDGVAANAAVFDGPAVRGVRFDAAVRFAGFSVAPGLRLIDTGTFLARPAVAMRPAGLAGSAAGVGCSDTSPGVGRLDRCMGGWGASSRRPIPDTSIGTVLGGPGTGCGSSASRSPTVLGSVSNAAGRAAIDAATTWLSVMRAGSTADVRLSTRAACQMPRRCARVTDAASRNGELTIT